MLASPKKPKKNVSCGKTCFEERRVARQSDCARWDQKTDRIENLRGELIGFVDQHTAKNLKGKAFTRAELGCLLGSLNDKVYEVTRGSAKCARWDQTTDTVYSLDEDMIGIVHNGSGRDLAGKPLTQAGVNCLTGSIDNRDYDPQNLPGFATVDSR